MCHRDAKKRLYGELIHLIQTDCREMCYIHRTVKVCISLFNRNYCFMVVFFFWFLLFFFLLLQFEKNSRFWIIMKSHCHVHLSVIVLVSAWVLLSRRVSTNTGLYLLYPCYPDGARWTTVHEVHWPKARGAPPWAWLWRKLPHVWPWKHNRPLPQHLGENIYVI